MQGAPFFEVGRVFEVTNPDHHVQRETLRVESFSEGRLCLRSLRHNVVDTASVHYTSEHDLVGEIEAETPRGFRVRLINSPILENRVEFSKTEAYWLV